mgnify:CR=1 FL=1
MGPLLIAIKPRRALSSYVRRVPTAALIEAACAPSLDLDARSLRARIASAMSIRGRLRAQPGYQPLRGRHLALLTSADEPQAPAPLQHAATALGARVAQVRHWNSGDDDTELARLGRALGRLYDAIDGPALAPRTLVLLRQSAGVPVYDGLDGELHPLRALAALMLLLDRPRASDAPPWVVRMQWNHAGSELARAFAAGAAALGTVRVSEEDDSPPDLVFGPCGLSWADGRPDASLDEASRAANHRALIQALLIETIGKA